MKLIRTALVSVLAMAVTAGGAHAQQPVQGVQDLVNSSIGTAGYQLQQRGYSWLRDENSGPDKWDYWRDRNGRCVTVHSSNARVLSLVYAPSMDCGGGQASGGVVDGHDHQQPYATVCGVITNGRVYRYRCEALDYYSGPHKVATDLKFPDMKLRMVWKSGSQVALMFEGMTTQYARYATHEGETSFKFEDKTYYYYSDPNVARHEVQNF